MFLAFRRLQHTPFLVIKATKPLSACVTQQTRLFSAKPDAEPKEYVVNDEELFSEKKMKET